MEPTTIKELDDWMTANCYTDNRYAIAGRFIAEGYGIDKIDDFYIWFYTERGERQTLQTFQTEQEVVAFALPKLLADKYARRHMVGFIKGEEKTAELIAELKTRNIDFYQDKLLYRKDDYRVRIFVFNCDINKVLDLQVKYGWPKGQLGGVP